MNRLKQIGLATVVAVISAIAFDDSAHEAVAQTQSIPLTRLVPAQSISKAPAEVAGDEGRNASKPADDDGKKVTDPLEKPGEKKPDPAADRLAKIKKLKFDRRPSSILKAWAETSGVISPASKLAASGPFAEPGMANLTQEPRVRVEAANAVQGASEQAKNDASKPAASEEGKTAEDPFDRELKELSTAVTLGRWDDVAKRLGALAPDEAMAAWRAIIASLGEGQSLASGVIALARVGRTSTIPVADNPSQSSLMMQRMMSINSLNASFDMNDPEVRAIMQGRGGGDQHLFSVQDFAALVTAAPRPAEEEDREPVARLLVLVDKQTDATEEIVARLRGIVGRKEPKPILSRRDAALILCAANLAADAGTFLLPLDRPETKSDPVELNLLARHSLAKYNRLGTPELLDQAWAALQAVMALEVKTPEYSQAREEATRQAISLVPRVDRELSSRWFEETFRGRPERGVALLTILGESANAYLRTSIRSSEPRLQNMRMLKTAVDALLATAPDRADAWGESLTALAAVWLAEARLTKSFDRSTAPRIQRDIYGNVYYLSEEDSPAPMITNPNMPQALPAREMVKLAPLGGWLDRVDPGLHPNIHKALAEICLKMGSDADAFPHIEEVARAEPELARELAQEFLRVWTSNHDMNQARNQRNPYVFIYGFEQKAESIPLTRSKQERNLEELAGWLKRLKALPIRPVDETLVARAFTTCHSSAEVYRMDAIVSVFGPLENLRPETIARLAQQMRANLAGLWRRPAVQDQAKTKRKEKDIREEVLRGYETATEFVQAARRKYPEQWSLTAAQAALMHDENNFRQEIALSPDFMPVRRKALALFAQAAGQYAASVAALPAERQTNDVFDQWFYAGLGACEPGQITETTMPETNQPALIRKALESMPTAAAESHMSRFANQLFTRMSALSPAVKFRYLKAGFEIVGDAPQAYEARKVYDYYRDLNREIRLEAVVDGPTSIDPAQPFGVYVNLRHTREIERESGGFGRYLQNQNQGSYFYYNYGRPLENYRDKFQEAATRAVQEHFEVLSVTFETEKVTSLPAAERGWRTTPYAYLLLKAKSPKVDRIPSLKIDLDFMDTSGYVILPVESAAVAINCDSENTTLRPFRDVEITQILDERQSAEGKLIVEIKTAGHGLMPPVRELVDLDATPSFLVDRIEDQGLAVSRFDEDSSAAGILSERTSLVTFTAAPSLTALPSQFRFPEPKIEKAKLTYQKYVDADLAAVEPVTPLLSRYGKVDRKRQFYAIAAAVAGVSLCVFGIARLRKAISRKPGESAPATPAEPFAVLGLLRGVERDERLSESARDELLSAIRSIEERYFENGQSSPSQPDPDLNSIILRWSRLAPR